MEVVANGSTGEAILINAKGGRIIASAQREPGAFGSLTGDDMAAHGMVVSVSGNTSLGSDNGLFEATAINDGQIAVTVDGDRGFGSGIAFGAVSADNRVLGTVENNGVIDVSASLDSGEAYGIHTFVGRERKSGLADEVMVSNTGIINVDGAIAHQLYVTNSLEDMQSGTTDQSGVVHVSAWNLSPVAAVSEDQKVFAVAGGATLNFGVGVGKGAQLILRTSDAGNNGHDGVAVTDLVANKGGTVTGVIDTVYSGGNVDGQNAADYQATLEGYNDYTQQSVYIDRAWQSNAAGNVRDGAGCAFGTCGLYSSTYGLGVSNDGTVDVVTGGGTLGAGLFVNLRRGDKDTAVGMLNTGRVNVDAGVDGTAYGVFARLQGDNQIANIANTGIVNVSGATAHQLYVTGLTGIGTGTANLSMWNLSPVAAVSEDQKAFAVAEGATLNLGNDKGNGAQLILRTSDAGNNGHDGVAVTDLVANKGGTVTGVIDTVYSGGNVDGKDAADYQATLEGYNDYTQQSVYIDRAWQFNAEGDTMNAVQCATITCSLYSSTQGLGLVNAGTLDADVGNSVGAGMYANLRTMAGITNRPVSLSNSGTITMKAGDSGAAYGMYARLQDTNQVANIANTGIIDVQGVTAHQLYVSGMPGVGGGTANVTAWNLDLYDRQSGRQSVFAVADGATLNFSNTSMMLRPGDVAKGYADNKKFNVKDMVYNYGNGAQVTGQIGSVSTPLPMLTAAYGRVDQNGADVWDNQWVSLNVEAEKGDGPTVNAGTVDSMQSQIDRVGNLLVGGASGGGIGLGDGDLTSVQLKVYYGNQQRRGVGASVTDSTGTVAYADYEIGEGHTLGWHGGVEYAHLRAKSKTLNINSLSAILGGQGRYNFSDTTYLRGQVSGILSNNNNHFNAFDGSTSKVSTVNFGMYGAVYAGYDYKPDENNTVTPEIGLSALWSHTPSMDVKYDRSPDLNHTYAAQNYTALYANAGVRWTGGIDINGTLLKPTVMAGVRQTLGDGKVKSAMTFNGNRFDTSITRDRTMGIVDAGVSTTVSTGFDVGLNYRGEYGSNTTNHVGYLNGTIRF